MFGEFSFAGDIPLAALAEFYGLIVPLRLADKTAADLFANQYDEQPQIGDSLRLSGVTLIVRELDEDRVHRVGLKFGAGISARGGKAKHLARVRALVKRFVRQK